MAMKRWFIAMFVLCVVAALIGLAKAETYPATMVVVSVDYDADEVALLDYNGDVWVIFGCEDWSVYDIAAAIMDDHNTATIYDDEVVSVRYDGWLDGWLDRLDY